MPEAKDWRDYGFLMRQLKEEVAEKPAHMPAPTPPEPEKILSLEEWVENPYGLK
eukprot:SAG31_NODE_675_length_12908_cov_11.596612_2_plen_54_part_00